MVYILTHSDYSIFAPHLVHVYSRRLVLYFVHCPANYSYSGEFMTRFHDCKSSVLTSLLQYLLTLLLHPTYPPPTSLTPPPLPPPLLPLLLLLFLHPPPPLSSLTFYNSYYSCTGYDPVGWGLPYGSFVATDTAKPLMESAVQVRTVVNMPVCVLISGSEADSSTVQYSTTCDDDFFLPTVLATTSISATHRPASCQHCPA